jgi:hydrogenase nickel incorporation protein HypA/HybF
MHEVSIAQSILNIIKETAEKSGAKKIIGVKLKIGEFSCINFSSLQFAFSLISQGTPAEGAKLMASPERDSFALEVESIEVENGDKSCLLDS